MSNNFDPQNNFIFDIPDVGSIPDVAKLPSSILISDIPFTIPLDTSGLTYFKMIQSAWSTLCGGEQISSFADIDIQDQANVMQELNNSLRDIWLTNAFNLEDRVNVMTTVKGQMNYDMPFNGELKQDGLLIQPQNDNCNIINKLIIRFNKNYEQFFMNNPNPLINNFGLPTQYCIYSNQLLLKSVPDKAYEITCLYKSMFWAQSVTNISNFSVKNQNIIYVNSTIEFNVGDVIEINMQNKTQETGIIVSINPGISFTLLGNLTFSHGVNERVTVPRQSLVYENDEPNFPSEYHQTVVYGALITLFYGDTRQNTYEKKFADGLAGMLVRSKRSANGSQGIRTVKGYW